MSIEPPNLNVPLYPRDWSKVLLPVATGFAAWLWHHPLAIPQAAVSFFVGGAVFWFAICSDFSHRIGRHRIPIVRGLWFVTVIVGVDSFMRHVIPYLHALV